jgi:hypothetical protein
MPYPNWEAFDGFLDSPEPLTVFLRCHQTFDGQLSDIINEYLMESHSLEISRIAFPVKVELAIALGAVQKDLRSPLLKFNAIRNALAHDGQTVLTEQEIRDFRNVFNTPFMLEGLQVSLDAAGEKPQPLLRAMLLLIYAILNHKLEAVRDQKLWSQAAGQVIRETVRKITQQPDPTYVNPIDARYALLKGAKKAAENQS